VLPVSYQGSVLRARSGRAKRPATLALPGVSLNGEGGREQSDGSQGGPPGLPTVGLTIRTFGPAGCCAFVVWSREEVVQMDVAYALAGWVREWAGEQCPGEPRVSDMAVSVALNTYFGGASVAEACEQARSFVVSRTLHPAHRGIRPVAALSVAS